MRCCVPFCKNTSNNVSTENMGISFHAFPSEVSLRAAWLRALAKQGSHLPDSAVVCSQHFLNDDIYETESGLRQIRTGALPSTVQVCIICLDTDSKLFLMSKHKLEEAYEQLTGHALWDHGNLKQTVCVQCAQRLINFSRFRDKCLTTRALMMDLVERYESITRRHIKMIKHTNHLKSDIVVTTLGPDPCDLYIVEHPSEDKQTDSEAEDHGVVVKNEGSYDSMSVDENTEMANEDDRNAEHVKDELFVSNEAYTSDDSIMLDTKLSDEAVAEREAEARDPLKLESAPFQCTLCFEETLHEHTHMRHIRTHLQNAAGDGECAASREREPHTAVSSGSSHSSLLTENKQAVHKLRDETHSSAELAQTAVVPLSARHATSNENKARAEEADTVRRSPQVFRINNGQSDTNSVTDIDRLTNCVVKLNVFKNSEKCVPVQDESQAKTRAAVSCCDSQCQIDTVSKHFSFQVASQNEGIGRDTNKVKHMRTHTGEKPFLCDLCEYKCAQKCHLVAHLRKHTGEKPFSCKLCKNKFSRNCSLVRHMRTHTGEKPYSCVICRYKCARKSTLVKHIRTHTGEKPFSCKLCKLKCSRRSDLVRHMRTHSGEKPFSCKLCKYKCSRNGSLVMHMRTHTGDKPFSCKLCKYKCSKSSQLVQHIRTHTGEKPFLCNLCEYKCAQQCHLVTHMRKHTGEKPFSCKLCKYKCSQKSNLVFHMKTHTSETPFLCDLCEYKCAQKCYLVKHLRTHTVEKPFSCKLCEYKCSTNGYLVKHLKTHTGERLFYCKLCEYKCSTNGYLVRHMRTHTGEKPFSCKLCEYKCSRNDSLVTHMRTHTGEKPYSCEICRHNCARKSDLVKHMRTHTGEKPFSCKLCKYKCSNSNQLVSHMRIHAGKALSF